MTSSSTSVTVESTSEQPAQSEQQPEQPAQSEQQPEQPVQSEQQQNPEEQKNEDQKQVEESEEIQPSGITPIKCGIDLREYRIIKLKNDLECMLISDKTTEKAAAAITVNVGHFADPVQTPGLAHFLEHMLFLGTTKYPDESEYTQFIKDNGGSDNASTGMHHTCFQFDIHSDFLLPCIDRFAQFFIAPLFTESATDRELNAVDSENTKNLQNDSWRQFQFNKSLAKADHPYSNFGSGNKKTLKTNLPSDCNLREFLLAFHKQYYSSSIMKLAILGKESLNDLQKMVEKTFCEIPNKNISPPVYASNAFDMNLFPKLYKIVPVRKERQLSIHWILPSVFMETESLPASMLSHLIGDEGPGSILAYLKEKDWATSLCAGADENIPEFLFFGVWIDLTVDGLLNWTKVITSVYQYIHAIQSMTDDEWQRDWEERKKVRKMGFNFQNKPSPYGYVTKISRNLSRNYQREKFLQHLKKMLFKCDIASYRKLANAMTTDNCVLKISCQDFESECKEVEKWYSTKYQTLDIEGEILDGWKNCGCNKEILHIPPVNPYIAENFSLCCKQNIEENSENVSNILPELGQFDECTEEPPNLMQISSNFQLWFKMDRVFRQPKTYITLEYISLDEMFDDNCKSKLEISLILDLLNDELSLYTYVFEEAGLGKHVYANESQNSIIFSFSGYNEKLYLLMETVLKMFCNLKITKNKFDVQYEKMKRDLESISKQQPYRHCFEMRTYLLTNNSSSLNMNLLAFKDISYDGVVAKYKSIFVNDNRFFIKSFIYGNENTESIQSYIKCIKKYLCPSSVLLKNNNSGGCSVLKIGCLSIPNRSQSPPMVLRFDGPNVDDQNSNCENLYFFILDSPELLGVLKLFENICDAVCFDQLRTKEQLGYLVWSYDANYCGYHCFKVVIQSAKKTAHFLNFRIESFLKNTVGKLMSELSDESLEINKRGVINNLLEKPKSMQRQFQRYWSEIILNRFQWKRRTKIADSVKKVNVADVKKFYETYIKRDSKLRMKLSVQCQTKYDFSAEVKEEAKESAVNGTDTNANVQVEQPANENKSAPVVEKTVDYTAVDEVLEKEMNDESNCCLIVENDVPDLKQKFGYLEYPWGNFGGKP